MQDRLLRFAVVFVAPIAHYAARPAQAQFPPAGAPPVASQPANSPFTPRTPAPADALDEHTRVELLGNGLRVLAVEDHTFPMIAVQTWVRVGSAGDDDAPGTCDTARAVLEHRGDAALRLRSAGVRFESRTLPDACYFASILPADENLLKFVLDVEAGRLAPQRVTMDMASRAARAAPAEGGFATDRPCSADSQTTRALLRRTNGDSRDPQLELAPALAAGMFHRHSYAHTAPGPPNAAVPAIQLDDFMQTWFVPANATVMIIGDVPLITALELARTRFAPLTSRDRPRRPAEDFPEAQSAQVSHSAADLDAAAAVEFGWQTGYYADFTNVAIEVLMHRLCNPIDGPLARRLRMDRFGEPTWQLDRRREAGVLVLRVNLVGSPTTAAIPDAGITSSRMRDERVTTLRQIVREELQRGAEARPSEIELIRARRLAARDAQRPRRCFADYAALLGRHEIIGGDVLLAEFDEVRPQRVSVGALQDAAAFLLEANQGSRLARADERGVAQTAPKFEYLNPAETLAALRGAETPSLALRIAARPPAMATWEGDDGLRLRAIQTGNAGATVIVRGGCAIEALLRDPAAATRFGDLLTFRGWEYGTCSLAAGREDNWWWTSSADELDTLLEFGVLPQLEMTGRPIVSSVDATLALDVISNLPLPEQRDAAARGVARTFGAERRRSAPPDAESRPTERGFTFLSADDPAEITILLPLHARDAHHGQMERIVGRLFGVPATTTAALDGQRAARWKYQVPRAGQITLHASVPRKDLEDVNRAIGERLAAIRAQQIPPPELATAVRLATADQFDDFASDLAVAAALAGRRGSPPRAPTQPATQPDWAPLLADALRGVEPTTRAHAPAGASNPSDR